MDKATKTELGYLITEALKRNDRTYVLLEQLERQIPEAEGDIRRARREAEAHQQATRTALNALAKLVREAGEG
jgi:hypothetical protein